jgi:hypothetical protein
VDYGGPDLPHIRIHSSENNPYEWVVWTLICGLAAVVGAAVYLRFFR